MLVAGAVNLSMVLIAATNLQGRDNTDSIEGAHAAVRDTLGPTVALFFAIGLLASGLASTSVGAYAGAMIMQGLLRRSYPLLLRRLVTLIPALVILAIGIDPSRALVISQVVLSFGIPFALIPLVRLTSNRAVMGDDTNHRVTTALGWTVAAMIILLNVVLIYLTVDRLTRSSARLGAGASRRSVNSSGNSIFWPSWCSAYRRSDINWIECLTGATATSRTGRTCACSRWRDAAPAPPIPARRRWPTTTG